MELKLTDLYKIKSDEFFVVELPLKSASKTNGNRVGKFPTSRLDHKLVSDKLSALKLNQNKLAKLAGVPRWVVNHFLKGIRYKKSNSRKQLISYLIENNFNDCTSQEKIIHCTCVHCGNKHRSKPLVTGE